MGTQQKGRLSDMKVPAPDSWDSVTVPQKSIPAPIEKAREKPVKIAVDPYDDMKRDLR